MDEKKTPKMPKKKAPGLTRVRTGVKAGSLNTYYSTVQGQKQGQFKGGG